MKKILNKLWNFAFPGESEPEGLKSDKWKDIGFQGKDPRTDFRGGGVIGLYSINYFIENFKNEYTEMQSQKSNLFYFAVFAINLSFAIQTCFHFNDDRKIMKDYRNYKCNQTQFKNFMKLFSHDKSSTSLISAKRTFYHLHGHLMITLVTLWNHYLK